jgi:hypothetical protein
MMENFINIFTLPRYYQDDQGKEGEIGEAYSTHGRADKYMHFSQKPKGVNLLVTAVYWRMITRSSGKN